MKKLWLNWPRTIAVAVLFAWVAAVLGACSLLTWFGISAMWLVAFVPVWLLVGAVWGDVADRKKVRG